MKVILIAKINGLKIDNENSIAKGSLSYYDNVTKQKKEVLFKDAKAERLKQWEVCFNKKYFINIKADLVEVDGKMALSITNLDPLLELNKLNEVLNANKNENKLDIIGDL